MSELTRRAFMQLAAGAGGAIAAVSGGKFFNKLIPYVVPPEESRPGKWIFYNTTCRECPAGCGFYLRHMDGRVVKPEGNPLNPINRGGICPRGQSSVQGLYDPGRIRQPLKKTQQGRHDADWLEAISSIAGKLQTGSRLKFLCDLQTGALAEVIEAFCSAFGASAPVYYEPFYYESLRAAHQQVFGQDAIPCYELNRCDFIISFSADFLESWISPVQFAWQFAEMHAYKEKGKVGRFTYVGPRVSMTAANADEHLKVQPGDEAVVALAMVQEIIDKGWAKQGQAEIKPIIDRINPKDHLPSDVSQQKIVELAEKFAQAESSIALADVMAAPGEAATEIATAGALLNYIAGRVGPQVDFGRTHALSRTARKQELDDFFAHLGEDDILFIHNANPVYNMPHTKQRLQQAGTIVYLGTMPDETAQMADWVLPIDSHLERWGDYEPYTGYHQLMQPTMTRVFQTREAGDILLALAETAGKPLARNGGPHENFYDWLRDRWAGLQNEFGGEGRSFEDFWRETLKTGGIWQNPQPKQIKLSKNIGGIRFNSIGKKRAQPSHNEADLWLWPSIMLFDGSVANRSWLQEVPHRVSYICWGSWIDIHPKKALGLGLRNEDVVSLSNGSGNVEAPVRITEDVEESTVALLFGQGHDALGDNARSLGANAFELRNPNTGEGVFGRVTITKTGRREKLVYLLGSRDQHHRQILRFEELEKAREKKPESLIMPLPEGYNKDRDLYPPHDYAKHRWAMVIDLNKCIGCGACAVACYSENSIPVYGKKAMAEGREMAWLKVVPYRSDEDPNRFAWLPLPCQQCDAAPCEPVCPVYASVHNEQGLNAQIYNRCVGTRYCSNNCPYKVRRFNWFNPDFPKPLHLQLNPNVTTRSRGVMEKCTFCVQRIKNAEYTARLENRQLRDGEVQPACVQSCPTGVYTFGDLLNKDSKVNQLIKDNPRRYQLLKELNTKPAIFYLERVLYK